MPDDRSLAGRGLPFLTWGLTFHILAIALLFGLFHVPERVVRAIAAWKELFCVVAVIAVLVRTMRGAGPRGRIGTVDLLAGGWIALAVMFVITENVVWHDNVPPLAAALGLRDAAFFVLFYFVGRATPDIARDERVLKRCFTVLVVVSIVALLEQVFVTPRMLVALGVASYINDFLGTPQGTAGNIYGLPDNYWSQMGGHLVRRSGSVFLSGQGFATPFVVLLPAASAWVFSDDRTPTLRMRVGYGIIWAGLLVSFTRGAIAVCGLQLILLLLYKRRPTGVALAAALGTAVLVMLMAVFPDAATFIFETLTWQTGSSASHLKDWTNGITAFFERPWGWGLGTTDQTAQRAGLVPITYDNLFLKYAVEMGVLGLLALVATLTAIGAAGVRLLKTGASATERGLGAAVALASLGIALDGMTGALFNNPIVAYIYFWYAGTAVTLAYARERTPVARDAVSPIPVHV